MKCFWIIFVSVALLGQNARGSEIGENILVNGGFESGPDPWAGHLLSGSTDIPGWLVVKTDIEYLWDYWQNAAGNASLDLNGNEWGGVLQHFEADVGGIYEVTFSMAGNPAGGPSIKALKVYAGSNTLTYAEVFTFSTVGRTLTDMGWVERSLTFTAQESECFVMFTSETGGFYGPALDKVSVVLIPPEPATPPVADADGPYTIWPGDPLILYAGYSTDPENNIVSYEWDLGGDGDFETDAGDELFCMLDYAYIEALGLSADNVHEINLLVTDSTGLTDTATTILRIVPEPATLSLLALGGLAMIRRRRR